MAGHAQRGETKRFMKTKLPSHWPTCVESKVPVVVIEVEGGCVQSVYVSGDPLKWPHVFIADYDNARAGEENYIREHCSESIECADDVVIESVVAVHKPKSARRRKPSKL
jgi:hypothetical protein